MNVRSGQLPTTAGEGARGARTPDRVEARTGLRWRVVVMAVMALLLIVLLAAAVFQTAQRYHSEQRWTVHSYQVRQRVLQLANHLHVAEMDARSFGLTGHAGLFRQYWRAIDAAEQDGHDLGALVAHNPGQVAAVHELLGAITARRQQLEKILSDYRLQNAATAQADVIALVSQPTRPIEDIANRMLAREAALLQRRETATARNGRAVAIAAALALGGSIALLLGAFAITGLEQHRRLHSEWALANSARELEQALRDANRSSETLQRLSALTGMLQNCRDLDEAIDVIEHALPALLPATSGALALISASRNVVEGRMHWGEHGAGPGDAVFAPDECWALRRSQPHPSTDARAAPACPHLVHAGVAALHSLCVPLNSQGQVLGVLSLCAGAPLGSETSRLAATVADQLALALANLQLQASLRTQSIRDPLTNLFNRRYLEASLPRELLRAERRAGGLSLLMLDLDHFKHYNDSQGHDAGDALLGAFGTLLAQSCRGEDIACRYGGEEFTLVLTDADHPQALERAEAIRKATANVVVHYRGGALPPATVSIGVASFPEHGADAEALLRAADQALYRAKHKGRNIAASGDESDPAADASAASRADA